jgi:hypothetical protein
LPDFSCSQKNIIRFLPHVKNVLPWEKKLNGWSLNRIFICVKSSKWKFELIFICIKSSKWKFEFTSPNQILELIFIHFWITTKILLRDQPFNFFSQGRTFLTWGKNRIIFFCEHEKSNFLQNLTKISWRKLQDQIIYFLLVLGRRTVCLFNWQANISVTNLTFRSLTWLLHGVVLLVVKYVQCW